MIIQCDACQTRFKLPDDKLKPGGVKVRCTSCEQVFHVPGPTPEPPPVPEPVEDPSEFDFSDLNLGDDKPAAEPAADEFDFDEFNMEDLGATDEPEAEPDVPSEAPPQTEEVKDVGDELPDFDLPEDYSFDAEENSGDDLLADFSPEELSDETEEFAADADEPEQEHTIDDIFGDDEETTAPADNAIEENEPTIGGDLGKTFDLDDDLSELPDLDHDEFGIGAPDEFSFDADTETEPASGLDELESSEGGPVEFSFDDEPDAESEADVSLETNEPEADDFIFESEAAPDPATAPKPEPVVAPAPQAQSKPHTASSPAPKPPAASKRRRAGNSRIKKRKKGNRTLPLFLLLLLVIGGAYAFLAQQKGTWDPQVLLQHVQQMINQQPAENPTANIELRNLRSSFISNQNAGQLFAISGEAINKYSGSRSTIAVKGIIYGSNGKAVMQQTVFCGNPLDEAALRTLPFAKIEEAMNNQFGDSLSNLDVEPGKAVPFTVVFKNLPGEVSEFNVEVADSRPGTQ